MFRGREVSHPELGMKILDDLAEQVSSVAKVEAAPKLDGRNMVMVLAPDRRARQAARKLSDGAQPATAASDVPPPATTAPAAQAPAPQAPATGTPPAGGDETEAATVAAANGAVAPKREPAKVGMAASAAPRSPA
jgi:translation initiation factor IF-3